MASDIMLIDSNTTGDPARFLSLAELEEGLAAVPDRAEDAGTVAMLMRRCEGGRREILDRALLTPQGGMPGDAWSRRSTPNPDMQIATMQAPVARLIANGQPVALFGDNLFLDLNLSAANLPAGTRLRAGGVLFEVTPKPHDGCKKFLARFGADALRFVQQPGTRHRNLRGIYLRVLEGGVVTVGDRIEVVWRPRRAAAEAR